jgi:hypothetical protein
MHACMHACMYVCTQVERQVGMHTCMYVFLYVCMHIVSRTCFLITCLDSCVLLQIVAEIGAPRVEQLCDENDFSNPFGMAGQAFLDGLLCFECFWVDVLCWTSFLSWCMYTCIPLALSTRRQNRTLITYKLAPIHAQLGENHCKKIAEERKGETLGIGGILGYSRIGEGWRIKEILDRQTKVPLQLQDRHGHIIYVYIYAYTHSYMHTYLPTYLHT